MPSVGDALGQQLCAFSASGSTGLICSASTSAPSRRLRRARSEAERGIESDRVALLDFVGKARFDFGERDRRRQDDAARRRRCRSTPPPPETARAPAPRPDRHCRRGHWRAGKRRCRRRGSWRCGRDRRARAAQPARLIAATRSCRQPSSRPPLHHRPRLLGAARAVAAELIETVTQIGIVTAKPAFGEHRGNLPPPVSPAPSGAASTTMRASRGGSGSARSLRPSSVMRPCASMAPSSRSSALASLERGLRRRIEKRELARIAGAPLRQIEHEGRQIGRQNFRPRIGLQANRSAARPTAGSRRPARCARRGRGAGRRRRATRARFPAA